MSRTRILSFAVATFLSAMSVPAAHAGSYSQALNQCLIHHVSHEDRAVLSRFIFTAIATNPDLKPYILLKNADRDQFRKDMTALLVRMWGTDCHEASVAALQHEGRMALLSAFPEVGRIAMGAMLGDSDLDDAIHSLNSPEVMAVLKTLVRESKVAAKNSSAP